MNTHASCFYHNLYMCMLYIIMNSDLFWSDYNDKTLQNDKIHIRTCLFTLNTNRKRVPCDKQSLTNTHGSMSCIFNFFVYNLSHPSAIKKWFSWFTHVKLIYVSIPAGINWFLIAAWRSCTWIKELSDLKFRFPTVFLAYL